MKLPSPPAKCLVAAAIMFALATAAFAGTAEEDWQAVLALDAGPSVKPKMSQSAEAMVVGHLAKQEKALRSFLTNHANDSHVFEAQLRLARLLQIRADFDNSEKPRTEAKHILDALERTATPEQRAEVEFVKLAQMMRRMNLRSPEERDALLAAARRFQADYPNDRRVAALLTEISTLFDSQPETQKLLLEEAQAKATQPDLKARIADDLKRVRLLGQQVPLSFTSVQGEDIQLGGFVGRPVFIIFFAAASPPTMEAVVKLQQEVARLPQGSVKVLGVDLDLKRETLTHLLKSRGLTWPTAWDGKGWDGPLVRGLGINVAPTVWLVDAQGRLRSLNALDGAAEKARQLMQER